ncbi:DUF2157 domain-containing protein [Paenisporosarcina quisquiliarum]|uniref:DUF2157 domain-containing protein n=1 Tax=Paenisporosarcina quisquiliarum TaxID=365346 RepID=UPI0037361EDA
MDWMNHKLKEWLDAGVIDESTHDSIVAYERKQPQKRKVPLFLTIGLIFFALAVFSFIAANWSLIPDFLRVGIMLGLMWGFYVLGHFAEIRHFGWPILFRLLGLAMFGASMLVTAQTFHFSMSDSLVPWAIYLAAIAHYFIWRHQAYVIVGFVFGVFTLVSSISSIGWVEWLLFIAVTFGWFYFSKAIEPMLLSWLLLFGSGLMLWSLLDYKSSLWPVWTLFVLVALLLLVPKFEYRLRPLYLMVGAVILVVYLAIRGETDLTLVDVNWPEAIALALSGIVVAAITWIKFRSIVWVAILGAIGLLLFDETAIGLAVVAEISALAYLMIAQRQDQPLTLGFVYFIVVQFVIYFVYAWERLDMSLFFLLGAILLFVLSGIGWWLKRKKEGVAS